MASGIDDLLLNLSQLVSQSIFSTDGRVTFVSFSFNGEAVNATNSTQGGFALMLLNNQPFVPVGVETTIYRVEGVLLNDCMR